MELETEKTKKELKSEKKKTKKQRTPAQEKRSIIIRAVLVGVFFVIAMISFTAFAKQCTHKEPGWYEIGFNPDEAAPRYSSGIELNYYFDGESSDITLGLNEIRNDFSETLKHIYKLTDPDEQYTGYVNIAYINTHPGEGIELDPDLYEVLTSAYELTQSGEFNMFAGALYKEWQGITVLEDSRDFDPLLDSDEALRLKSIAEKTAELENFKFEIIDHEKHIIRFDISDEYRDMIESMELSPSVIDLAFLRDAYELDYTAKKLEEKGRDHGYITAKSGITRAMSGVSEGVYFIYSQKEGTPAQACRIRMEGGSACCSIRSFSLEEDFEYYTVEKEGKTYYRHPHFDYLTAEVYDALLSACAVSYEGNSPLACIKARQMMASPSVDGAAAAVSGNNDASMLLAYIPRNDAYVVRVDKAHSDKLIFVEGSGFTAAAI